jgi:hypothetical protein
VDRAVRTAAMLWCVMVCCQHKQTLLSINACALNCVVAGWLVPGIGTRFVKLPMNGFHLLFINR